MIPAADAFTQYTGTGSRTFFEYGFEATKDSIVVVTVNGASVDFVMQDTGVVITPAPALGTTILIYRWTDITQLTDWQPFDDFNAAKTEDAADKLIMLKQEAWQFRHLMMLIVDRRNIDRVTILNDKGDDAHLFYWGLGEQLAGMFGGEVSENIPVAGAVVEKPWDFAYFQYDEETVATEFILTSTLYPIEDIEHMQIGVSFGTGVMDPLPEDTLDVSYGLWSVDLVDTLIQAPPVDDQLDIVYGLITVDLVDTLIEADPVDDALNVAYGFVDATLITALITGDTPDEELQLGASIDPTLCSMTPV